jgi:hypothetical protein
MGFSDVLFFYREPTTAINDFIARQERLSDATFGKTEIIWLQNRANLARNEAQTLNSARSDSPNLSVQELVGSLYFSTRKRSPW